jgi:maltooligosyltrehalose trehalohydrolase
MHAPAPLPPGAHPNAGGTTFVVLSTNAKTVAVRLFDEAGTTTRTIELARDDADEDRFALHVADVGEGALYKLVLDGDEVPDPYARFLPAGVHGPARVTARTAGERPLANPPAPHMWSIYELHVGTFSRAGTFLGAIEHLDHVAALGVTAIELMPIAAFEGQRGWGYDGVALYAPHAPYGSIDDLRALVRAAHARGLAVILDVVYNHFGPSGNYLSRYAREYFTAKVKTPWGDAPDFGWQPMRDLVLDNVAYWLDELGFDGLRLDATHAIHDETNPHILHELARVAHERGRRVFFEDERNDPDVVRHDGADGVWADDFHHQIHVLLTGERDGYYGAYEPTVRALASNIRDGWTFSGAPYPPWDGKPRGKPPGDLAHVHLVTCIQNHDQVGNRAFGDRLNALTDADSFCAAVALSLLLPSTPLLFMGQEWAASSPFLYFSDHGGDLGTAVSNGRRDEFKHFAAFTDASTRAKIPDPEALQTFETSRLRWDEREGELQRRVLEIHREMLRLRKIDPVLGAADTRVDARALNDHVLEVTRQNSAGKRTLLVSFAATPHAFVLPAAAQVLLSTSSSTTGLSPRSVLLVAEG